MSGTWTIKFVLSPGVKLGHADEVDAGFSVRHLRVEGVVSKVLAASSLQIAQRWSSRRLLRMPLVVLSVEITERSANSGLAPGESQSHSSVHCIKALFRVDDADPMRTGLPGLM